jgi:flagellar biosynthesis protein FlhG
MDREHPTFAIPAPPESASATAPLVTIASGKGGVGKTSIAVNLSVALAQAGLRATLLDADLGTANADVLCGLTPAARLDHVLTPLPVHDGARRTILDIVVPAPGGFDLIPGSAGVGRIADLPGEQRDRLLAALRELEGRTDVIVADAAAGIGQVVISLVNAADIALIVATPEPTSIADAYGLIKSAVLAHLDRFPGTTPANMGLVVNQAADWGEARAVHARIDAVCDRFLGVRLRLAGWIAQDLHVCEAVRARHPMLLRSPQAPACRQIRDIAARVTRDLGLVASAAPRRGPSRLGRALSRLFR